MRELVIALVCAGCWGPAKSPAPATPAPTATAARRHVPRREIAAAARTIAIPGEMMEMEGRVRGIFVGRIQVVSGEPGVVLGRGALITRTHAESEGLFSLAGDVGWDLTTTIDLATGAALASEETEHERFLGDRREHRDGVTRAYGTGDPHYDLVAAIDLLRANATALASPDTEVTVDVEIGRSSLPVTVWLVGREHLAGALTPSLHVRGKAGVVVHDGEDADAIDPDRDGEFAFDIWLSDDAMRVPQRFHARTPIGGVDIVLVDYRAQF